MSLLQRLGNLKALFTSYRLLKKMITQTANRIHFIYKQNVSALTSVALMADVVNVERFPSARKSCAYLRTAPRVSTSNTTVHIGRNAKQGRSPALFAMCELKSLVRSIERRKSNNQEVMPKAS